MAKPRTPIVSIDLECTGLICGWNEIFEIAFVKLNKEFTPTDEMFHSFVRVEHPERFTQEAQDITGKTIDEIMSYPEIDIVKQELEDWIKRVSPNGYIRPLGQFYDGYDRNFLKLFLNKEVTHTDNKKGEIITTVYDKHITRVTMDLKHAAIDYDNWISYNRIPFKKIGDYSLKDIAAYCNVINPKAHSALNDAKTTALCYKRLLGMKRY